MPSKLTEEIFLERAKHIHNDKYAYPKFVVFPMSRTKISIFCPKHGNFLQRIDQHLQGSGCPRCGQEKERIKITLSTDEFINRAREKHGNNFNYSLLNYINQKTKVEIICPVHGNFWQLPDSHLISPTGCPSCYKDDTYINTEKYIDLAKKKYGNKFDYSKTTYVNDTSELIITCPIHGDINVIARNHLRSENGCRLCANEEISKNYTFTQEQFIIKNNEIHGNTYDYSLANYTANCEYIDIICKTHGVFKQRPMVHWRGSGCPQCNVSIKQKQIGDYIESLGFQIEHNNRKTIINPKTGMYLELDILLPAQKFAIEYGGFYYHNDNIRPDKNYHQMKTLLCHEIGYTLLTIFEDEWREKQDIVKSIINHRLGINTIKIGARQCTLGVIDNKHAKNFLNENHIQGYIRGNHVGLIYNDTIISLMTVGKSRYDKQYEMEILRFANKINHTINGAASRLFKFILKKYSPSSVISYADLRFGFGEVYERLEFIKNGISLPGYFYCNGHGLRESRIKYQKHKLIKEGYDPTLTEEQIMMQRGYHRIWDCGHAIWIYQVPNHGS